MDEWCENFLLIVSIRTEITIRTVTNTHRIVRTELFLVFEIVVMFFNKGMGIKTSITFRTFLFGFDMWTHLSYVKIAISLAILGVVIVNAMFVVVVGWNVAGSHLEDVQIEMLNLFCLTLTRGAA
jgi:hypothetical protein